MFASIALDCLPGGEEYKESGYLAILDQIKALEWIKENIAALHNYFHSFRIMNAHNVFFGSPQGMVKS